MKKLVVSSVLVVFSFAVFAQEEISADFDYSGVKDLRVKGKFAKVIIEGTSSDKVTGSAFISGDIDEDDYEILQDQEGDRLYIEIRDDRRRWSWRNKIQAEIRLKVPKGIDVMVDNSSGRIEAEELEGDGIELESASGSIEARDILAKEARIQTASGSVEIVGLKAEFLDAKSASGRVSLRDVEGDVKGTSGSGRIEAFKVTGILDLKSGSGSVQGERVTLTGDSNFRSGSGSVRLYLTNDVDKLSYDLSSGSGSVHVGGERMGKKYYYKNGDLRISAVSGSGSIKIDN